MDDKVDLGQFKATGAHRFDQLNAVRRFVRLGLFGRTERVGAVIEVTWADGEIEELVFDHTVGYPTNKPDVDWLAEWKAEIQNGQ